MSADNSTTATTGNSRRSRVVHLPCYDVNPYQRSLMHALSEFGWDTVDGGGGGNFLRSALFRWRCDAIHLHWLHPYIVRQSKLGSLARGIRLIAEVAILRLAGKRLIWTVHNLHNHQGQHRDIERWTCRWVSRIVHKMICHSQHAADRAADAYGASQDKLVVTPHPRWDQYPNTIPRENARERLGMNENATVFLLIGRVAPYKGVEDLINAFGQLLDPSARLVIAGGPISDEYGVLVRNLSQKDSRIQLQLGFVEPTEMQVFLNASDVVVFPFQEILTSGSVILAMEFAKPCIAPAIGAIPEVFPDEQCELIYDPDVSESLANCLRTAVAIRERLSEIGAANARRTREWTWAHLASICASLYRDQCAASEVQKPHANWIIKNLNGDSKLSSNAKIVTCESTTT